MKSRPKTGTNSTLRWPAFSVSVILHIAAFGFLAWVDAQFPPAPSPHYNVLILPKPAPQDDKIVWYDFRKTLPEVNPDHPFGPAKTPQGEKDPSLTLVTLSPDASSTRQLIRQPDRPEPLPADAPVPNLVAVKVKLPPKVFVPPSPPAPARTAPREAIDVPRPLETPKPQPVNALGALASLTKLPPKPFVPPAARSAAATPAQHVDAPTSVAPDPQTNALAGLEAVMVGLNPGTALPPPGSRSAQIARAPEAGTPSSGAPLMSGATVPGLLSHGKPGESPAPVPVPAPSIPERSIPQEIVLPGVNRTMSAPLRPSARLIPATVETRFKNKNVYTLVIPAPSLPGYGGDWVMWFAEHDPPEISSGPRILAPIPARKYSPATGSPAGSGIPVSATFQFAGSIDKNGHFHSAVVLRGPVDPALRLIVLEELGSWEFKPALHNGEPIEADVVVEIPFRSQPAAHPPR